MVVTQGSNSFLRADSKNIGDHPNEGRPPIFLVYELKGSILICLLMNCPLSDALGL